MAPSVEAIEAHTIYEVVHGSQAYGMALPTSDRDRKGVCLLPDRRILFGLELFEQRDTGWDGDKVVYHLPKFLRLAAEGNPAILETLFVDEASVLVCTPAGARLRAARDRFLSRRCRHTFTGYAKSQLGRIQGHKRWLDAPPEEPRRERFVHRKTIPVGPLGTTLGEGCRVLAIHPAQETGWFTLEVETFDRNGWDSAVADFAHYRQWREKRNPARAALEAAHSFDTKHAAHLVRLLRMGLEILVEGVVRVRRPDAAELLSIRNGAWSYERILEHAAELEARIADAVATSPLPEEPDRAAIDALEVELIEEALRRSPAAG